MARFIPASIKEGTRRSERLVWEALSALDDSWTVHHSLEWQSERDGRQDDGEADFVLVSPNHGVIVMEVKGGKTIEVNSDGWISTAHNGERHAIKNPFKQAQASKRALIRFLKLRLVSSPRIPFGHLAVFPSVTRLPALGPEAPDEIAWRQQELIGIQDAMPVLTEHWRMAPPIGEDLASAINAVLAPEGVIRSTLADEVTRINAQIESWTAEQAEFLEGASSNARLLVSGGAGTGKTVLAVEAARRAADAGENVLLTCFNKPLGGYLESMFAGYPTVTAGHFHRICNQMTIRAFEETGDPDFEPPESRSQQYWDEDAAVTLVVAVERLGFDYDTIIIDEGQDFSPLWFEALESLSSGPNARLIVMVDKHQQLFLDDWASPANMAEFRLSRNCRNTRQIAARVSSVWSEDEDARGAFGRPPEFVDVANIEGARRALKWILHRLINEGQLAPSQVTVLCQHRSQIDALSGLTLAGVRLAGSVGQQSSVLLESVRRFKGLESDAVVLLLDSVESIDDRSLAYVGMSRACAELFVLAPAEVRDSLNWS